MPKIESERSPIRWGLLVLALIVVGAMAATYIYVRPPGKDQLTFYTHDAASIRAGDNVRISGVTVGKVKDLAIEPDRVRVRMEIDTSAFIGDQSQVQVRMLTVVGGYYVNLISLGDRPIGRASIPVERVTMPYSLARTLADATKITDEVNPKPVNEVLNQTEQGLEGPNLETLSNVVAAGNEMTETIERQKGQISKILGLTNEYTTMLAGQTDLLRETIRKVALAESVLAFYAQGFGVAWTHLGNALNRLSTFGLWYMDHRDKFLQKFIDWQAAIRTWAERSGAMVQWLRGQRDWMERILQAQDARPEVLATDVCIPVSGSAC
ncbi:MlaD family protein [Mycobacterium syngnathidarum]